MMQHVPSLEFIFIILPCSITHLKIICKRILCIKVAIPNDMEYCINICILALSMTYMKCNEVGKIFIILNFSMRFKFYKHYISLRFYALSSLECLWTGVTEVS